MKQKLRLLVIEDNADDILLLKEMIAELDEEVYYDHVFLPIFVNNLQDAIEYLTVYTVDIILLDLSLPGTFGIDTLVSIQQSGAADNIPIVILTVLNDKEAGIRAVQMGAQEYLVKSNITGGTLRKSVRYAVERQQLTLQLEKETNDLKQSEDRFIKMVSNDPDGVVIADSNSVIVFANPSAEILFGLDSHQLVGKSFGFPIIPDETSEITLNSGSGKDITAELRSVEIDWQGKEAWLISLRDITGNKELMKDFLEENERLDITLRSIADAVIAVDSKGIVRVINQMALEMLGLGQIEAVGKPVCSVLKLKNKTTGAFPLDCKEPLWKVDPQQFRDCTDEWVLLGRLDNKFHEIHVECSYAPIQKNDEVMGAVWVIRDVTEKKELEEEIIRSQNLESLGLLAGGIAHEYNNILTSTLGYVSLVRSFVETGKNEKLLARLKKIEKAGLRAKEISTRLLTFSKGGEPRKKEGSIVKIIKHSARPFLKFSHIKMEWNISDDIYPVLFDLDQMILALSNIFKNAVESMPNGGVVSISIENIKIREVIFPNIKRGNYVKITVTDQGPGISREVLSKVFSPYFTTKERAEGMGLPTAYSIIRKHGGWIRIKPNMPDNKGTMVSILLPAFIPGDSIEKTVKAKEKKTLPKIQPAVSMYTECKGRILVMDDEESIREVAKDLLETLQYETAAAENGEQAVRLYKEAMEAGSPFYAAVLDLVVTCGMGGKECIQHLLEIDPLVKAIVSSGYSSDPVMANFQEYGFSGVLPKPYHIRELQEVLERFGNSHFKKKKGNV